MISKYRQIYVEKIGEKIAEARQQSGAEKLKGHDIMALERFDQEVNWTATSIITRTAV